MAKATYVRSPAGEVFATSNPDNYPDWENLGRGQKGYAARQTYVCAKLRETIKPGDVIYTLLRHVSKSGMARNVSVYTVQDGKIRNIDVLVSDAIGRRIADGGGLHVRGCGYDAGFGVVYALGQALWPDGTPEPHSRRNGEPDSHGGYALRHEWL